MADSRPPVRACLFDMDGLLINTEDMYTEATNEFLAEHGKPPLPWEVKIQLQGLPGPKAAAKLLEWAKVDISPEDLFAETSRIQERLWPRTQFLPGALELLQSLHHAGVPIALATSSMTDKYFKKTQNHRAAFELFGKHVVTGDDPRIPPGRGKPAPDIWETALRSINEDLKSRGEPPIKASEALVFEDGIPGLKGAVAAGCPVVWVPHPEAAKLLGAEEMKKILPANGELLASLSDFDGAKYGLPTVKGRV